MRDEASEVEYVDQLSIPIRCQSLDRAHKDLVYSFALAPFRDIHHLLNSCWEILLAIGWRDVGYLILETYPKGRGVFLNLPALRIPIQILWGDGTSPIDNTPRHPLLRYGLLGGLVIL